MCCLLFSVLFLVFSTLTITNGANILGIYSHAGDSHNFLGQTLLKELARRGHNVTMASAFPLKHPVANYTDIHLTGIKEDQLARDYQFMKMYEGHLLAGKDDLQNLSRTQCEMAISHPEMKKLIESGTKFDVIIMDWFLNHAVIYFGKIFNAPVIPLASQGVTLMVSTITGNPVFPSYIPNLLLPFTSEMTFMERVLNTLFTMFSFHMEFDGIDYNLKLIKKHFNEDISRDELFDRVALFLCNGHYSFETPRPTVPNVIPIGGFHVQKPKPLPKDLQIIMDKAKDGVIYFSLGTQMKSILLPPERREVLLRAFAKLKPIKVLWKWEGENILNLPDNVLVRKWFPQNDILAHPNLKVFISHGGVSSVIEALYHGVAVLGMPIFGDQKSNIKRAIHYGYAIHAELRDLTEDSLVKDLNELLYNRKYAENAKKRSMLLRDQPINPMDMAVFWVEHVIRHKGAPHLKNSSTQLSWFQYLLIDVIVFLIVIVLIIILLIYFIFKLILKKFVGKLKTD